MREFRTGDERALRAVFHSAIHGTARRDYTPEQLEAWSPTDVDWPRWLERMRALRPFVAEWAGAIAGYADVQPDGYIDHFFVAAEFGGRGVGRKLMERLHEAAAELGITELFSEVSLTAQPFFEHFGFRVTTPQTKSIRGVVVPNAVMRKSLSPP